jgi:EthD domain
MSRSAHASLRASRAVANVESCAKFEHLGRLVGMEATVKKTQHDDCQVKTFAALPRRPDISERQFHDHWRHPHGSMGLTIPLALHYVQSHRIQTPLLSETQKSFDGIVEIWMRDLATAAAMPTHPEYLRVLREDEPRFIDMTRFQFLSTRQVLYQDLAAASANEADRAWSEQAKPITIKLLQFIPPERVSSNQPAVAELAKALGAYQFAVCSPIAEIHGENPPFGEVREFWWPTLSIFEAAVANVARETLEPTGVIAVLASAERYK